MNCKGGHPAKNSCPCEFCRGYRARRQAHYRAARSRAENAGTVTPDEAWRDRAACKGKPLHWFYPQGPVAPHVLELCDTCPVRVECHSFGRSEEHGVWGGVSRDRRRSRVA